ncbi:membrane dipeptidase [Pontibacillus halophilus JSM 076056 = DSM 19796]|uniref:Membrane dipeptidase n=1 Tax=Pontibacillus halophilus JSM 076056 = DSM 19796 TaxID=1385510 RepID=A0A0A5GMA8_9BACI|nr:membrane dipeptidase [Pontibacillus halophilus]KGX93099.1 membrane dipeptidase [Pontibacillus halophilus JSM 076056 = DSM 19796]
MLIDAHCDALLKLWEDPTRSFVDSPAITVNYENWMNSPVKAQCFALFVPPEVPSGEQFRVALEMVDLFYDRIIAPFSNIKVIHTKEDLQHLKEGERGAILTLEGCHPIGDELIRLKTLLRLGVKSVGLTWNNANATSDGILEERGAGLSSFGNKVVDLLNEYRVWTDVSHLSYKGFWDVMERADYPMASHSNVYEVTSHQRNLNEAQLHALIGQDAFIGVTFVPSFLEENGEADLTSVMTHVNRIIELGGENVLGFGSDFDGTDERVAGLTSPVDYEELMNLVRQSYSEETAQKLGYKNFLRLFPS